MNSAFFLACSQTVRRWTRDSPLVCRRTTNIAPALILILAVLTATPGQADTLARWQMEETSGTVAFDSSPGTAYDLNAVAGFQISTASTVGHDGAGFYFDGTGSRLEQPTLLDVMPAELTIAGWVKPDATGMSGQQCWLSKQSAGTVPGPAQQLWLAFRAPGGTPGTIAAMGRANGSFFMLDSGVSWTDDTWYHIALTWGPAGAELYVDGVSRKKNTVPIMGNGSDFNLILGTGGYTTQRFKGVIDSVEIHDEALSADQIGDLYSPPTVEVNAGGDQFLDPPMNAVAILDGTSEPQTGVSYSWSKVSGPGDVAFADNTQAKTTATIHQAGDYVLRLTAIRGSGVASDELNVTVHDSGRLTYPIVITEIPKATANLDDFDQIYTVDTLAYGISTDGTNAEATSAGIIQMLADLKIMDPKPNRLVFPTGTYLIDENQPIVFSHRDLVVDLNGSTFKIRPNALSRYTMMFIDRGSHNFRLTNGTLLGDRFEHDYLGNTSPHYCAGCTALAVLSGTELELDHINVVEWPGFALRTSSGIGNATTTQEYRYVRDSNLESGGFDDLGQAQVDGTKIRTMEPYDLDRFADNEMEVGRTWGYQGLPYITQREYRAFFFDQSMTFLEKQDAVQYKKVSFSESARYVHFEFNQPEVPTSAQGLPVRITDLEPSEHVHFHHNTFIRNRGLGVAFVGGQKWIMEDNYFEENGTEIDGNIAVLPAHAIDFEGGWDLMQDIIFRNNIFVDNANDLVLTAGSEIIIEGNQLTEGITAWPRCENMVFRNNEILHDPQEPLRAIAYFGTKTGNMSIHHNTYQAANVYLDNFVAGTPALKFEHDTFRDIPLISMKSPGSAFIADSCSFERVRWLVSSHVDSFTFTNNTFLGPNYPYLHFFTDGVDVTVTESNNSGTLVRTGPHTDREQ